MLSPFPLISSPYTAFSSFTEMFFYTRYFVEEDIGLYSNMVILGKLVYFRLTQHKNIPVLWNE